MTKFEDLPIGKTAIVDGNGAFYSATNPLQVDTEGSPSILGQGTKTVTTAGTAVALATSTTCKKILITADISNTGVIYVGGSGVDSSNGTALYSGDTLQVAIDNLATVYIDSSVSSEGVSFIYTA